MTYHVREHHRSRTPGLIDPRAISFVPTWVSGCRLWLDASQITGLGDGDLVALWEDKSGNNYNAVQTVAGQRPTYKTNIINGKPVVRNAAGKGMLLTGMVVPSGSKAFFAVISPQATGIIQYLFDTETGRLVIATLTDTSGKVGWYDGTWRSIANAAAGFQILCWNLTSGGNGEIFRNGTSLGTAAYSAKAIGGVIGLFQVYDQWTAWVVGDLAEFIVYDSALGAVDRVSIENYLNSKYAIY